LKEQTALASSLLQIKDLHVHFSTDQGVLRAVNGLDVSLGKGETLGLVGESGCGKTVTGLSVLRLIPQPPGRIVGGQILFEGKDLLSISTAEMRRMRGNRISMIFQEPMSALNPALTVGFQISEVVRLHQGTSGKESMALAAQVLHKVGISDVERRLKEYPHQMSGGMRQRAMIAMALACAPEVIIADEPTTALDVTIQAQILELLGDIKKESGTSILLITHDLGVVAQMADHVAVMYTGEIVEFADTVDLLTSALHPYTIGLMKSIPKLDEPVPANKILPAIPGIVPSLLKLPKGCSFQDRCDRVMKTCRVERPVLFEIEDHHWVRCWSCANG
jgi:oligopeptide/dipeptide ABC transporter ATP-binding protein